MRKRGLYLLILFVIIPAGLLIRKIPGQADWSFDLKDTIWAMMVYFLIRLLFVNWPTITTAASGMIFSIAIEFSQLYHAEWIDRLRNTFLGGIILGTGFVWSDLIAYLAGIIIAAIIDNFYRTPQTR